MSKIFWLIFDNWIFPGSYCPSGTKHATEHLCPAGTYNNKTGANSEFDCLPCTGKCLDFFPVFFSGQHYDRKLVYVNTSVIFKLFVWPGGKYCNGDGLAEPTGDCAPGWYCLGGAYTEKPTTYVNSTTLYSTNYSCPVYALNNTGGICEPGNLNQQFPSTEQQLIRIIEFSTIKNFAKLYLPKIAIIVICFGTVS